MTPLSKEEIELKKYEAKLSLIKKGIFGLIGTVAAALIAGSFTVYSSYQESKSRIVLEETRARNELKLKTIQVELEFVGQFIDHALKKDVNERLRFSEYLSTILMTPEIRQRWAAYHQGLKNLAAERKRLEEQIIAAQKGGDSEREKEIKELGTELNRFRAQMAPSPTGVEYLTTKNAKKLYLCEDRKPQTYTVNDFEEKIINGNNVVIDKATGLMWQQSGAKECMNYVDARSYIAQLNRDNFAGYSDWRFPTLKEAITLLNQEKSSDGLFIDSKLDKTQKLIWTSDPNGPSSTWVVYFDLGSCGNLDFGNDSGYVRAAR